MKNGNICKRSKTIDRCSYHADTQKFKHHITDSKEAEKMMKKIFKSQLHEEITCPCGKIMIRWNFAHHCSYPKHKFWVGTMPKPETIKSWSSTSLDQPDLENRDYYYESI